MFNCNSTRKGSIFLLLFMFAWSLSQAQNHGVSAGITYYGAVSDYNIVTSWSAGQPFGNFSCGADNYVDIYLGTTGNGSTNIGNNSGAITNSNAGSITNSAYPAFNDSVYCNFNFHGQCGPNSGCVDCSEGPECHSECQHNDNEGVFDVILNDILAPYNLSDSTPTVAGFQIVSLNWQKGSDIPDDSLGGYKIYRDGTLVDSVAAGIYTYTDSTLLPAGSYIYSVTTYTGKWRGHESQQYNAQVTVLISNPGLVASQGTYYAKTHLSWPNMAVYAPNGIQVMANGQQLAVANKNATTYDDVDGIPGVKYQYAIAPINANNQTPFQFTDSGYSRPNGIIKGTVNTPFNAYVPGVTLVAYANVNGTFILDSTVTDASGFYQFNDLFYDTSATYTIVPHKGSHRFNPDTLTRTLSLNSNEADNVDFTDTSVFTIQGKISFYNDPHCPPAGCFSQGVSLYVNGAPANAITDAGGNFRITIQQEGTYTFTPVLQDHIFTPDSIVLNVTADTSGLAFTDQTSDTLTVSLFGGCGNPVAVSAIVQISDSNHFYSKLDTFAGSAPTKIVVPAQVYNVMLVNAENVINGILSDDPYINNALGFSSLRADLIMHDTSMVVHSDTTITTVPARYDTLLNHTIDTIVGHSDTTVINDTTRTRVWNQANFVYHGTVTVTVPDSTSFWPSVPLGPGCNFNNGFVMNQGSPQPIVVHVDETYQYSNISCPVDSGVMTTYDDVSGLSGPLTDTFYNGRFQYTIYPGSPNVASPYTKLLQFFAQVGNSTSTWGREIVILGVQPQTATFVTKTPELPLLILHDPPGNASYSYLAKDSTYTSNITTNYSVGGGVTASVVAHAAALLPVPLSGIVGGAGAGISASLSFGGDYNHNASFTSSFSASQQFSTSSDPAYVGPPADVFVGASFNMIYSLANVIQLNGCGVQDTVELSISPTSVATSYMYTESQITGTVIPQLQSIYNILVTGDSIQKDSALIYKSYIDCWNNVLAANRRSSDTAAIFQRNVSFSAGVPYDNSVTTDTDNNTSIGYTLFLNANLGYDIFYGADLTAFDVTDVGVAVNFNWNLSKNTTTDLNQSNTIGYHLEDDNPGNYFSVNVNADATYGTPCFTNLLGASACPHEPGTQARDSVNLTLNTYDVFNVPITEPAVYTAYIQNLSESNETRTYSVAAVPESNPDGAIISIGGQQINNSAANFTVAPGTALPVVLTVQPGPTAADYTGLQVSAFSPCDGGEGNTITFETHFQSTCSPIGLYTPADNWLINASNHDSMLVIFSGYDINNTDLISVGLEYQEQSTGSGWIPYTNYSRAYLLANGGGQFFPFIFNCASLPDGNYAIRAYANCGSGQGEVTYSPILSGTIDRTGLSLFGTPTPANGVLNISDNISVTFNNAVNCNQASVYNTPISSTLVRQDNGQAVPDSVTCSGNSLIIYTNPPSLIDSLENVTLTCTVANVYDMFGNELQQPIVWSFLVNRSKVYWNPSNMNITSRIGADTTVNAIMYNVGSLDTFTIIHMPSWLSTPPATNYVISNGTPTNPSQLSIPFTTSNSLNPGSYSDTVVALANGKKVFLFVNLDVVSPSPNWTVNASNYQYSMNITANYSTTSANAPLSSDTRDLIAAFVGNQCRGVGNIAYDATTNTYSAFITAYSNSAVGDTFAFRIWDALPGIEYQAAERLPFITDGSIGQPTAPYILHADGQFQTVTFVPGWNWFSLNLTASDMSPKNVLSSITGNNGAVVKTQNLYDQFTIPATGWTGTLNTFSTNTSYMIYLDHADTLHFLGQPITDTSIISIASGWNWIGFPRQKIAAASSYLSNANASNGDILKSETQFTQFDAGNWAGSLNYMYPGEGYKLRSTNSYNFPIPPDRSLPNWNVNQNQYEQNMTVTADLQFNGTSTTQSNYLVGAFANNACIGIAQPQFLASENLYRVFITIQGDTSNANQPLTFKVYDTDNDIEYVPTYMPVSVVPDTVVAKVEAPYVINVQTTTGVNALTYTDGYGLLQNVPNPFAKYTSIQYTIPSEQEVTLTLYDESGRQVRQLVNGIQAAGSHTISFEQDELQAGVYFYQMRAGDFIKTRKMLILLQ